jgi:hypothetical protein
MQPSTPKYAGVHLSGPNANKTALAVLEGEALTEPLRIVKVYEKIGSFGTLFSDERLVEILLHGGPFHEVFIDCPLTVPPCVACVRPTCPGAVKCDDLAVAYMLSISAQVRRRGARKARPVNPQSQRLWDVLQLVELDAERLEPSYSSNMAPLVTRARTLQRRLNGLAPRVELKETSVAHALEAVRLSLDLPDDIRTAYRNFEAGLDQRVQIVEAMLDAGWLEEPDEPDELCAVTETVEGFHAFMAALVGAMHDAGRTAAVPDDFVAGEGWVHVPELDGDAEAAAGETKKFFE